MTGEARLNCCSDASAGEVVPAGSSLTPVAEGVFDYYDYNFVNEYKDDIDPYAELTPILDKASTSLMDINHLNVMKEVLYKNPTTGEITKDLANIPVPNLMINTDWLEDCKRKEERKKFAPIVPEGDVAFNYNDDFQGTAKITKIDYNVGYDHQPKVTIEAIVLNK